MDCPSRRTFLRVGGAGLAVAVLQPGCTGSQLPNGPIEAGNLADTPVGTLAILDAGVVLGRDDGGLYALSAVCTHAGCIVIAGLPGSTDALICPCHASKFSAVGAVTSGPAVLPLPHYQVDLAADGTITVQAGTTVDAAARTPTP
jgi:cytochrome b6-f complex iron-sulfur subunit